MVLSDLGEDRMDFLPRKACLYHEHVQQQFSRLALITHIMVHPSLGQVLIRQGWEASLPDMELNKFMRVASAHRPILKTNNT